MRRGLVLGAGGVLGFTWTVGALHALEQCLGMDVRDMDVIIGTSAGSIMAAMLANGVSLDAVLRHQRGRALPDDVEIDWNYDSDSGSALPPLPMLGLGSPRLLLRVARHPSRYPPFTAATALLPKGRGRLAPVTNMVERISHSPWPQRETWIVAVDYTTGARMVFGRNGSPDARLSEAVTASCAIPGWYAPVRIGGRLYVDGGTHSPTSLDLLAGGGLDEVFVLAPMAASGYDKPWSFVSQVERSIRRTVSRRVQREAERVTRSGTAVTLLAPGPEDLRAIGANMMDHRRRRAVLRTSLLTSSDALRARRSDLSA
ncbi:MAG: patatin-like phospholipase family protein [Geodermatophilaceae bacterium]|nr:patatin-like phospholipase family protein [Geodermatophilaceae bacterium]